MVYVRRYDPGARYRGFLYATGAGIASNIVRNTARSAYVDAYNRISKIDPYSWVKRKFSVRNDNHDTNSAATVLRAMSMSKETPFGGGQQKVLSYLNKQFRVVTASDVIKILRAYNLMKIPCKSIVFPSTASHASEHQTLTIANCFEDNAFCSYYLKNFYGNGKWGKDHEVRAIKDLCGSGGGNSWRGIELTRGATEAGTTTPESNTWGAHFVLDRSDEDLLLYKRNREVIHVTGFRMVGNFSAANIAVADYYKYGKVWLQCRIIELADPKKDILDYSQLEYDDSSTATLNGTLYPLKKTQWERLTVSEKSPEFKIVKKFNIPVINGPPSGRLPDIESTYVYRSFPKVNVWIPFYDVNIDFNTQTGSGTTGVKEFGSRRFMLIWRPRSSTGDTMPANAMDDWYFMGRMGLYFRDSGE